MLAKNKKAKDTQRMIPNVVEYTLVEPEINGHNHNVFQKKEYCLWKIQLQTNTNNNRTPTKVLLSKFFRKTMNLVLSHKR